MSDAEWKCYREGEDANDHNRRAYRRPAQFSSLKENPYPAGSAEWKAWNAGYQYRDMVNDG